MRQLIGEKKINKLKLKKISQIKLFLVFNKIEKRVADEYEMPERRIKNLKADEDVMIERKDFTNVLKNINSSREKKIMNKTQRCCKKSLVEKKKIFISKHRHTEKKKCCEEEIINALKKFLLIKRNTQEKDMIKSDCFNYS